jgi:hypothetical protein
LTTDSVVGAHPEAPATARPRPSATGAGYRRPVGNEGQITFDAWLAAVFDPTAPDPWPTPAEDLALLSRLLEDPARALAGRAPDAVAAGLWSVLDSGGAGTALALGDPDLPLDERIACVRLLPRLYESVFVPGCREVLGHLDPDGRPLETTCYMVWDIAAFGGPPGDRSGNLLEDAVLDVLADVLAIEHAACQESAIHGLGHRVARHPERAPDLLRRWLRSGPVRDPRLRAYAEAAVTGSIQ